MSSDGNRLALDRRGGERDRGQGVPPLPPGQDNRQVLQAEGPAEGRARQPVTGIGENTLAQPVKPPLRERRACLAKLVKNRLTLTRAIRSRGAAGVRLVVSDAHPGLVRALGEVFQGAAWQRCAVHLMRDCMREAGSWQLRRRVGRIVSQVFRGREAATVTAMYHAACDMLAGCCPRVAAVLEEAEPDALAYLDFPPTHWKRLRTNNVQERTNREIKRRSRVVQVFPSTGSLARLAGAVMCELDEIWQESRYFSEARMNELYDDGRTRGIDGPVDWARLEVEARGMLESGLELADRVEAA